jgi:hypothetical protein
MESHVYLLSQFSREFLTIELFLFSIFFLIFVSVWYKNRLKYKALRERIPNNNLKGYLESVITNTEALRSSLFGGDGTPKPAPAAVAPSAKAPAPSGVNVAELNGLKDKITSKDSQIKDLNFTIEKLQKEKQSLEATANKSGEGVDPAEKAALEKKISELQERLTEYEIIEDDLAELKHLQQENQRLKASVDGLKTENPGASLEQAENAVEEKNAEEIATQEVAADAPAEPEPAPVAEAAPEPEAEPAAEAEAEPAPEPALRAVEDPPEPAAEAEEPAEDEKPSVEAQMDDEEPKVTELKPKNQDSSDDNDLLKEFEAMLEG